MSTVELRCEWRPRLPDPLPGVPVSHFQSPLGERQLIAQRDRPHALVVSDAGGRCLATWLLATTGSNPYERSRSRLARELDAHLMAVHGPTLAPDLSEQDREAVLRRLLKAVHTRAVRTRPVTCRLDLDPVMADEERAAWERLGAEAGFASAGRHTYFVDLPETIEEMTSRVKRERRKEVRKGEALGIEIEHSEDVNALRRYHDVRNETLRHNGHNPISWEHWERTHAAFSGSGGMHILLATLDGRVGAGQLAFAQSGYVYLVGVSVAEWARAGRVPANDCLQMGVLHWAIESGLTRVDFVGAKPGTDDPKLKAIDYFKSRWGTTLGASVTLTGAGSHFRLRAAGAADRLFA